MTSRKDQTPAKEGREILVLVLVALVVIPFVLYAGMILQGKEPAAPDTIAVRPLGTWALDATRALGTTPQWIPFLFSGMPSYGSYVYTPASPLSPLDHLLRPFADQRGIRYFLLMLLGGFSGFFFFRRQGVSAPAAAVAALGFVLTPYIPGVIEAGHSTKLRALMHAPLVLLAVDYFLDRPGPLAAAALALAAAMLGWSNHPQIFYYTGMAGALYGIGKILGERSRWPAPRLGKAAIWLVLSGVVTFCLVAEPTLAVREYAPYSIRGSGETGGVSWQYATAWSFYPKELPTFLFPEFYGLKGSTYFGPLPFTQSTHYVGITFLLAAAFGMVCARSKRSWIWLAVSLVFLVIGFGEHFPVLYKPLFLVLPYFSKFRVPSMIYSLLPLVLGYLVATGCDAIAAPRKVSPPGRPWWIAACLAAGVAVLALVVGLLAKTSEMQDPAFVRPNEIGSLATSQLESLRSARWDMRVASIVRGMLLVAVFLAAVPFARRLRRPVGAALLGIVVLADLLLVDTKFIDLRDRAEVEAVLSPTPAIQFLQNQPKPFRVFPIEEFGSNRFVAFEVATVGGYQPAKLRLYQDLLDQQLLSRPAVLSMLNVRYILSQRDPGLPSFVPVAEGIYEFVEARPRAWFVPSWRSFPDEEGVLRSLGHPDFDPAAMALFTADHAPEIPKTGLPVREVAVEQIDPHLVRLRVGDGERAGLMVVSEIYYRPGWKATIDGRQAEIIPVNHCLRALLVPPGAHEVEMRFSSDAYRLGRTLNRAGGGAVLLLALVGVWLLRRTRREAVGRGAGES